jgi:hypothetical protein
MYVSWTAWIREDRRERWLVRHKRPHVLRVPGHERQRIHGAAAAGEEVDGSTADLLDDPMQIVSVLFGRRRLRRLGEHAPFAPARIVGHDGSIAEMAGEGAETGGPHRRTDEQQRRLGGLLVAPHVVGQRCAGHVQGVGGRLGGRRRVHAGLLAGVRGFGIQTVREGKTHRFGPVWDL